MKIAMWSGPRNLSTAMMYSFANRPDFDAMDEPFYAPYLKASGAPHPMRAEIIAAHETDPAKVAAACATPPARHRYMKHMSHHMMGGMPLDWALDCVNIHLIRHPARVIASYISKHEMPSLNDIGYAQQAALYDLLDGPIIDSDDIRRQPETALRALCDAIGLSFHDAMLHWPAGPKPFDGIWAAHWYGAVHRSTGFAGPMGDLPQLEGRSSDLCEKALPDYDRLKARKLTVGSV